MGGITLVIVRRFQTLYQRAVDRWIEISCHFLIQVLALPAFLILFAVTKQGDLLFAIIKLGSMLLRRGAQALLLKSFGGQHHTLLVFPFGVMLHEHDPKPIGMHLASFAFHAGPTVELLLAIVGLGLRGSPNPALRQLGTYLFLVNALTALWSLVPLGGRDGGLIMKNIYQSSTRFADWLISLLLTILGGGMLIAIIISPLGDNALELTLEFIQRLGTAPLILILIIGGAWYNQRSDDDNLANQPGNLTLAQKVVHLSIYVTMVLVTLWVAAGPTS